MVYFNLVDMGRTINSPRLREPTVTTEMENDNEHRNGDTTTHYSAPKLAELMAATENVCRQNSGTRHSQSAHEQCTRMINH